MRTSTDSPIRVDFVAAEHLGLPGRLGLTIAPGKLDRAREWERDLDVDLAQLRDGYGATVLVSLMEPHEYELLGVPGLFDAARARGLFPLAFPIRDVRAPRPEQMPQFLALIGEVLAALRGGHTVVVHCRGGIGRSGTVAAACLVALGGEPALAIERVRAARVGAVEHESQEQWVHAVRDAIARDPHVVSRRAPSLDTIAGCLLGGAIGDALGYPIEFQRTPQILARFGDRAPERLGYGGDIALVSDDTQMTLFVAEGLLRSRGLDREGAAQTRAMALLAWLTTQGVPVERAIGPSRLIDEPRLHARRAPGNTCLSALAALARPGVPVPTVARPPQNDSKGCGAVMRAAPFGLVAPTREAAFDLARDDGVITHAHPSGYLSGAYLAALIWDVARGATLHDALPHADALLAREPGCHEVVRAVALAVGLASDAPTRGPLAIENIEALGGGWVGEEALSIGLACALAFGGRVESALWRAVAHSGDSDSTGAIAGNLIGASVGARGLPARWLAELELRDVIEQVANELATAFFGTPR